MKRSTWWRRWYWAHVHRPNDGVRWAIGLGWYETIEAPEWRAKWRTLCVTVWGVVIVLELWPITARRLEELRARRIADAPEVSGDGYARGTYDASDVKWTSSTLANPVPVYDEAADVPADVWERLATQIDRTRAVREALEDVRQWAETFKQAHPPPFEGALMFMVCTCGNVYRHPVDETKWAEHLVDQHLPRLGKGQG